MCLKATVRCFSLSGTGVSGRWSERPLAYRSMWVQQGRKEIMMGSLESKVMAKHSNRETETWLLGSLQGLSRPSRDYIRAALRSLCLRPRILATGRGTIAPKGFGGETRTSERPPQVRKVQTFDPLAGIRGLRNCYATGF
jgi:hypothetical protein